MWERGVEDRKEVVTPFYCFKFSARLFVLFSFSFVSLLFVVIVKSLSVNWRVYIRLFFWVERGGGFVHQSSKVVPKG